VNPDGAPVKLNGMSNGEMEREKSTTYIMSYGHHYVSSTCFHDLNKMQKM
jgi:hypothetical protein